MGQFSMKPHRLLPALLVFSLFPVALTHARQHPLLGAQVWIEPGQTPTEIDGWFQRLADSHMPVARLFMMWSYLETAPDAWDYTLYDTAFRSAEKHHVKVGATLTPSGPPPFRRGDGNQGGGVVGATDSRKATEVYIAKIVERYKESPALDTWLLVNEPGQTPTPQPLPCLARTALRLHRRAEPQLGERLHAIRRGPARRTRQRLERQQSDRLVVLLARLSDRRPGLACCCRAPARPCPSAACEPSCAGRQSRRHL